MMLKLLTLKYNIEKYMDVLEIKCPISPLIVQSIDILIDMDANESDIKSWARNQRLFIKNIENEIEILENSRVKKAV